METLAVMIFLVVCFVFYFTQKFFLSLYFFSGQWCMAQSVLRNWLLALLIRCFVGTLWVVF